MEDILKPFTRRSVEISNFKRIASEMNKRKLMKKNGISLLRR